MIELFLLIYGLLVWLVFFKKKWLPWNEHTILATILIAVVILGSFFGSMAYFQPISDDGRIYAVTTPIVPKVRGRVIDVPVEPEMPLNEGDLLFRIDPTNYEGLVASIEADLRLAQTRLGEAQVLFAQQAGTRFEVELYAAQAAKLEAQLKVARADLDSTVFRAPTNGIVTQLSVQRGAMAVPFAVTPMMVFVHDAPRYFVASFRQNVIREIDSDDEVEVAMKMLPGYVIPGRVRAVLPATGRGQLAPTGTLRTPDDLPPGRIWVLIELDFDLSLLPAGAVGRVTVYTGRSHVTELIRRIILRMNSWLNYIPFDVKLH